MDKVAQYFTNLGRGEPLKNLDVFKDNLGKVAQYYPPTNMMHQFWLASRAATRIPSINQSATARITRDANNYLYQEVQKLEAVMVDPSVTIEHLEKLLNIYARLQVVPEPALMEKIKATMADRMIAAKPETLARLLNQFVEVGVYPGDEWMEKWWEISKPRSAQWDLKEGYSVLYQVTLLDFLRNESPETDQKSPSPCESVANMFLSFIQKNATHLFSKEVDSRVFFAAKWFERDFIDGYNIEPENGSSSRAEENFGRSFKRTEIIVGSEGITVPEITHKIDLKLTYDNQDFGVEFDGILHFNRLVAKQESDQSVAFNTSTRFQSWLIAELCPDLHVLRVPYFTAKKGNYDEPWEETLENLRDEAAGVYAYHGNGILKNMTDPNSNIFKGQDL